MPRTKSESVKKNTKVVDKYMEDGGIFEDDEFWEELRGIKRKKMEDELEEEEEKKEVEEKMEKEMKEVEKEMEKKMEEMRVKEEEMEMKEEKKEEKSDMNFDNKFQRRRERDKNCGERGLYKQNTINKYFENSCELLANDKTTLF
jgi:hypothetical protein